VLGRLALLSERRREATDLVKFIDCRHHFASWFMMRGGNLLALSKILGHAKVSMTEKYAHLAPDLSFAKTSAGRIASSGSGWLEAGPGGGSPS